MPAQVTIICGPARCGKTERLLKRYRAALRDRPPESTLWLAPTWRAAKTVRDRLLDGGLAGCFSPRVTTFDKFAVDVLSKAGRPIRQVTRLMKRELVRGIIDGLASQDRLKHFLPIAKTAGLVDLVCEFIAELKRLEIEPPQFLDACKIRGLADKDSELHEIYAEYQQLLQERELFDLEGRLWSARDELQGSGGRGQGPEDRGQRSGVRGQRSEVGESKFPNPKIPKSPNPQIPKSQNLQISKSPNLPIPLPSPLSSLPSFIVADGFTDFTRTQHEILESLAARAEEMYISLPLEPEPRRSDLFSKPLKTLEKLRQKHANAEEEWIDRPAETAWPAMARLERTLFANPREAGRLAAAGADVPSAAKRIEILAAARRIGEIEMIAARIKRLMIDERVPPDEIAVVFRSTQERIALVREVFDRTGIPAAFESGGPLARRPALRALVNLLQLDLDDWPFDRLLAVLGSNYFQPGWPEWRDTTPADVEQSIRTLQIPRGRARLIEQLAAGDGGATGGRGFMTLAVVNRLAAVLDALPRRATLPEWGKAWEQLAAETGLLRAMDGGRGERGEGREIIAQYALAPHSPNPQPLIPNPFAAADSAAWQRLMNILADSKKLAGWLGRRPAELDRRAAFETLLDILGSDRAGGSDDEPGRVRVLSAPSVRSLRVPYLFLAGLSEKVFPPPDREDRLYSDAEYLRLIEADPKLPLATRAERARDEMLLFYEAATRVEERLYLSYPALDEAAQPLLPSPFLDEVEQAFGPGVIPRVEQTDLSPVPRDDDPLSAAEFRVKAVAAALDGNVALLAGLMGDDRFSPGTRAGSLAAGLLILHARGDRERFGPAEGVLRGAAARRVLESEYSAGRTFAATELERYAYCPFRFFFERILKIEPVEDLSLEFDVLNRGRIAHDVLSYFHRQVNRRLGRPASPLELEPAEFDALLAEAVEKSLPPAPANPLRAAMREIDRRLVVEWMSRYRGQVEKYDAQWKGFDAPPVGELFEVSFGREGESPPSTAEPLIFESGRDTVRISGRIDRVDVGRLHGRAIFNVLDYKTGGPIRVDAESVKAGTTLQLPIYALAALELLPADRDALPWRAGYWYVRDDGFKPRQALRMYCGQDGRIELDPAWEEIRGGLGDAVAELVRAIRRGCFPVCCGDERCTGRCPYATVCRVNHVRSLEKSCRPTKNE